jgi:hypothetical protein
VIKIGQHVIWHNPFGKPHDALITNIWGDPDKFPSINVVVVNLEEGQSDSYGQKIQRETSVVYKNEQSAHGRFWTLP